MGGLIYEITRQKAAGIAQRGSTMKNLAKLFGIIALVAVIGFSMASCDNGNGGGGGGGGGDGSLGVSFTKTYSDVVNASNTTFDYVIPGSTHLPFSSVFVTPSNVEVSVTGTTLTMKLGEVRSEMVQPNPIFGVSNFFIVGFATSNAPNATQIYCEKETDNSVGLLYVNEDINISDSIPDPDIPGNTIKLQMSLKKGWNTVLLNWGNPNSTITSGTPGSSYKWQMFP